MFTTDKLLAMKIVGLAVGCLANFTNGNLCVFNLYQNAMRDTFNYTLQEVEVFSSMQNLGLGIGFIPGMFYDRFGPRWTSAVGLVISVPAYLLIWSTTKYVRFFTANSWLMAIYFFMAGLGSVFTYMLALNTNVINFPARHSGKIIGLLNACFAGSPSVYASLYYGSFTHGDSTVTANQDFPGFMLLLAISFAVVDILCMAFLRIYEQHESYDVPFETFSSVSDIEMSTKKDDAGTPERMEAEKRPISATGKGQYQFADTDLSIKQVFFNKDFQNFIWIFAFSSVVGLLYVNNITVISKSTHLDSHDSTLTILVPISNAVLSASIGIFSDHVKDKVPRMWIIIVGCILFTISQILVFVFAETYGMLILATVLAGMGTAIVWSMSPTIMKELFYVGNIGRNWGIAILLSAVVGIACQQAFGVIYDHQTDEGSLDCYGMKCFRGGIGLTIACALVSIALGFIMECRGRCERGRS